MNASRLEVLWRLRLPSALPVLLATSRYVIGLALAAAYYGEGGNLTSVGEGGLGTIGRSAASQSQGRPLWATVFATVLLGVVGLGLVSLSNGSCCVGTCPNAAAHSTPQRRNRRADGYRDPRHDPPQPSHHRHLRRPSPHSRLSSAPARRPVPADGRCAENREAGTITYLTGFDFAAAASMVDVFVAEQHGYYDELCLDVEVIASFSTANYPLIAGRRGAVRVRRIVQRGDQLSRRPMTPNSSPSSSKAAPRSTP